MKTLRTTREVIDALGGTDIVSEATGASRQSVSNWRVRNHFPAHTFFDLAPLLTLTKTYASVTLWAMKRKVKQRKKK